MTRTCLAFSGPALQRSSPSNVPWRISMRRLPKVSVLMRKVPSTRRSVSTLISASLYKPWAARTACVSNRSSRAWVFMRSGRRWFCAICWRSDAVAPW
ncbi:hypothetical protein D3C87_1116150 [compost metagenome]